MNIHTVSTVHKPCRIIITMWIAIKKQKVCALCVQCDWLYYEAGGCTTTVVDVDESDELLMNQKWQNE